ncbi:hypothetical protein LCGC14_1673860, partial [marine sediment metagenome]
MSIQHLRHRGPKSIEKMSHDKMLSHKDNKIRYNCCFQIMNCLGAFFFNKTNEAEYEGARKDNALLSKEIEEQIKGDNLVALYLSGMLYQPTKNIKTGINVGIQNGSNSCTIASLLYSMFACTKAFDELLIDAGENNETREVLIELVNKLRKNNFVSNDDLLMLREKCLPHSFKGSFTDPDEFITALFYNLNLAFGDEFINGALFAEQVPQDGEYTTVQDIVTNLNLINIGNGNRFIKDNTKFIFIQMPKQSDNTKAEQCYTKIFPQLAIEVDDSEFMLQAVLV